MRVAACVAAMMCACASTASATATIPNDLVVRQVKKALRAAKTSSNASADEARGRALAVSTTFCDFLSTAGTCALKTSSETCAADASCAWASADSECGMSEAETMKAVTILVTPALAVTFQQVACALDTAPTCSSVECENFAAANACVITKAEATTLSSGDAFLGAMFHRAMKCSQFESQSTCTPNSECAWEYDEDEKEYTCTVSDLGTLALSECPALTTQIQTFINDNPQAVGLSGGSSSTSNPTGSGSTSCRLTQTFTLTALVVGALALVA